jgi:limonene-1,2-epoxide hydrolase
MPLGPALSTRGPDDIIAKLKIGLAPLSSYENHDGVLVSNGDDALYEHSETWNWDTGETALLRFVTVHKVRDGKIAVWKDYWDMSGLTNTAPATWLEGVTAAYAVPMFDATGLI